MKVAEIHVLVVVGRSFCSLPWESESHARGARRVAGDRAEEEGGGGG